MAGGSITLTMLDEESVKLWDAPVHTSVLRWGMCEAYASAAGSPFRSPRVMLPPGGSSGMRQACKAW